MKALAGVAVVVLGLFTTAAWGGGSPENRLFRAVEQGAVAQVRTLLSRGAKVNARDQYGDTPLHWAAGHGHTAVAALLVAHGADVTVQDRKGQTPLFGADNREIAELLIAHGARVDARDVLGQTPLDTAAWRGRLAVVKVLIAHGGDVNAKDERGFTPLDNAAWSGSESAAVEAVLRSHGAVASRVPGLIMETPPKRKAN